MTVTDRIEHLTAGCVDETSVCSLRLIVDNDYNTWFRRV